MENRIDSENVVPTSSDDSARTTPEKPDIDPLMQSASALAGHFVRLFVDGSFRRDLRNLAQAILEHVPDPNATPEPPARTPPTTDLQASQTTATSSPQADPRSQPPGDTSSSVTPPPDVNYVSASQAVDMLQLGGAPQSTNSSSITIDDNRFVTIERASSSDEVEYFKRQLRLIAARCELKSDAARWAAERRRLMEDDNVNFATEIEPLDKEIILRAKEFEQCFLWTNHPSGPEPLDLDQYESLAECFESLALASRLVHSSLDGYSAKSGNDILLDSMQLMAEAQSALRVAVVTIEYNGDQDQRDAFQLLQSLAQRFGPVARYMRTSDIARPEDYQALREKIESIENQINDQVSQEKDKRKLLSKIRWEAKQVQKEPDEFFQRSQKIIDSVCLLSQNGMPPSNVDVREAILPLADQFDELGESLPDEMVRLLREVNRFLARNPSKEIESTAPEYSEDVKRIANVLRGKKMMMIGGERRRRKQEAIRAAFELEEFIWDTALDHTSLDRFIPGIRQDGVEIVLLAIRWSSHSYSELEEVCRNHGKIFVRLPGGTSPNQIANKIMEQAGKRLFGESTHAPKNVTQGNMN